MPRIEKDCRNNWRVEDEIDLGNGRALSITTSKVHIAAVHTRAQVGVRNGSFFTFTVFEDFTRVLKSGRYGRATKGVVGYQHLLALQGVERLKQDIANHYAIVA